MQRIGVFADTNSLRNPLQTRHFCMMRHSLAFSILIIVLVTAAPGSAEHPIVRWTADGHIDSLAREALINSNIHMVRLCEALTNEDAAAAIPRFRQLVENPVLTDDLLAIAWQRLHSYAMITNDSRLASEAARWLNDHPSEAAPLFHGTLPTPSRTNYWTAQIGAFSSRSNADRLAADQRSRGYTVQVDPIQASGQTLYAVRVGRFDERSEADEFARRVFGAGGYRLVENTE
jgi:SPOR domain